MGLDGVVPGTAYTLITPKDGSFAVDLVQNLRLSSQPVPPGALAYFLLSLIHAHMLTVSASSLPHPCPLIDPSLCHTRISLHSVDILTYSHTHLLTHTALYHQPCKVSQNVIRNGTVFDRSRKGVEGDLAEEEVEVVEEGDQGFEVVD